MTRLQKAAATLSLLALALCFNSSTSLGKNAADPKNLTFLKPTSVDVIALLPAFSSPDSAEGKSELAVVLTIQSTRTAEESERVKTEKKISLASFTQVLGEQCTPENLPKLNEFLQTLDAESKFFSNVGKLHFKRPRPTLADAHVVPLIEEKDESYPSGHSTRGMFFALILAELFPEHRDQLLVRGQELGWNRVIAGVHYPSDVYAGRTLGQALAHAVLATPAVQEKLPAIRAEIAAARHQPINALAPAVH